MPLGQEKILITHGDEEVELVAATEEGEVAASLEVAELGIGVALAHVVLHLLRQRRVVPHADDRRWKVVDLLRLDVRPAAVQGQTSSHHLLNGK